MKKSFYILAFLSSFLFGMGAMFEFLVWPGRGMIVCAGFVLLNFGVLPVFFYQKYRLASK